MTTVMPKKSVITRRLNKLFTPHFSRAEMRVLRTKFYPFFYRESGNEVVAARIATLIRSGAEAFASSYEKQAPLLNLAMPLVRALFPGDRIEEKVARWF